MYERIWIADKARPGDEQPVRRDVLWPVEIDGRLYYECAKPDCERAAPDGVIHCCTSCAFATEHQFEIHEHSTGCDERWKQRRPYVEAQRQWW